MVPNPWMVLTEATKAVPAVRYFLAVAALAATVAIVKAWGLDARAAVLGSILVLILAMVVMVFARATTAPRPDGRVAAAALMWFCTVLFMIVSVLLVTGVFWSWPVDLPWLAERSARQLTPRDIVAQRMQELREVSSAATFALEPIANRRVGSLEVAEAKIDSVITSLDATYSLLCNDSRGDSLFGEMQTNGDSNTRQQLFTALQQLVSAQPIDNSGDRERLDEVYKRLRDDCMRVRQVTQMISSLKFTMTHDRSTEIGREYLFQQAVQGAIGIVRSLDALLSTLSLLEGVLALTEHRMAGK